MRKLGTEPRCVEPASTADPVAVGAEREGALLQWSVRNGAAYPIWAFLMMPNWTAGTGSASLDHALVEKRDDLILLRKVFPPRDELGSPMARVGAIEVPPGGIQCGSIAVESEVQWFLGKDTPRGVWRLALEVGWVPSRGKAAAAPADRRADGARFSFMVPGDDQALARSPVVEWRTR